MKSRISEMIEREGMTQSQFADYIGVNRPTLSHILSGRNNPSMEVVMKIHQKFPKINLYWLIDGNAPYESGVGEAYPSMIQHTEDTATALNQVVKDDNRDVLSHEDGDEQRIAPVFYQGELFAENRINAPKDTANAKKRKEMPLQTPLNEGFGTNNQTSIIKKILHRKIDEIKVFYDDGTYETFKQP